jgi:deoxycytidylate deaminase
VSQEAPLLQISRASPRRSAQDVVLEQAANELVFGVVGHVGSGTSEIAQQLREQLTAALFEVEILRASKAIEAWAKSEGHDVSPREPGILGPVQGLQDLGNRLRSSTEDPAAVAMRIVYEIRTKRATQMGVKATDGAPVHPDGTRRAWIVDSLRHPAEVELLRHIYHDAFVLIGVVCDEDVRKARLLKKFNRDGSEIRIGKFMERDAAESDKFGQKVADTFHMSDYFIGNSEPREKQGVPNEDWDVTEQLGRLVRILTHSEVVRPTVHETAMHAAYGAQLRSACLSRQVGAALVSRDGQVVATGANEVPRFGGGVYGQRFDEDPKSDHRCAFRTPVDLRGCSNTKEQRQIIDELITTIESTVNGAGGELASGAQEALRSSLRKTRVGGLIEFSRAVHAEMDALIAAARVSVSPVEAVLYVTTFPCHYCARHIVAAGVREVQYIEPYPKSLAIKLHSDSICISREESRSKVLFRPFSGVSPRLYRRAFLKDRELKDKTTGGSSGFPVGRGYFTTLTPSRAQHPRVLGSLQGTLADARQLRCPGPSLRPLGLALVGDGQHMPPAGAPSSKLAAAGHHVRPTEHPRRSSAHPKPGRALQVRSLSASLLGGRRGICAG